MLASNHIVQNQLTLGAALALARDDNSFLRLSLLAVRSGFDSPVIEY
jgi:hypothetical protein